MVELTRYELCGDRSDLTRYFEPRRGQFQSPRLGSISESYYIENISKITSVWDVWQYRYINGHATERSSHLNMSLYPPTSAVKHVLYDPKLSG
jgi:hypothetical protein